MASFRTIRQSLAPRWLTDGDGGLLGYALDLLKDGFAERTRLGLLVRFPQQGPDGTPAPDDALVALGRDRRVVRGISETSTAYAARLLTYLDERRTQGNPYTLMRQLAAYCGPLASFRTVDTRGNWYSRAVDGTQTALLKEANWDWDGEEALRWSRFWVIIYPNGLWTADTDTFGDPTLGDDPEHTLGSTATAEHVATVRAIVADWKPAGTRCQKIILAFDAASFDPLAPEPDGLWGRGSKVVSGVRVPSRLQTARYWDGVG